ncbi:maltase [Microstroma glucosiphilum]|uniref:Maltase n=1 Tax=Pseudomicrostroma glucosiphilum TaxID=1684307 RepID=A0A316UE75_9BASI|nr:maltase [Pseudomicrostroma glucosiphilum]PWN23174.1 maltase [Pseudomicrostroma glucosiphilum]
MSAKQPLITKGPHKWWMDAIIYQIWPASFQDSNGDGVGDLPGILSRLDYIKSTGATAIWISPFYDSPQHDMGYDIANYEKIHEPYGNMEDMDAIIKGCHDRGMRIFCDLVVNHTSDQHDWFKASRSSKDDPKRDWYIWRPAKYDADGNRQPPNNWRSCFNQSAWEWDEKTQEYYLHLFVVEQPDLNWECKAARQAILDSAVRFWLDKGVDGFRIDTASLYSKPMDFPDAEVTDPGAPHQPAFHLFSDGPNLEGYLRVLGKVFNEYDSMTVGEFPNASFERSVRATSAADPQMSMNFHFALCDWKRDMANDPYQLTQTETLSSFKRILSAQQTHVEGTDSWPSFFLENHDIARSTSRYISDAPEWRVASAKVLACLMATASGTLYIYQGQELGQVNFSPEWPLEEYLDVGSINYIKLVKERGGDLKQAHKGLAALARDHARTPVQWSSEANAGFSTAKPWMRVADEYKSINMADEDKDPKSVLSFYRKAIALRKEHLDTFGHGLFRLTDVENDDTIIYSKLGPDGKVAVVALNFTTKPQKFAVPPEAKGRKLQLLLSSLHDSVSDDSTLEPMEGRIYLAV